MPKPGSRQARGYGQRHETERRRWKPLVDAGNANCWRCGKWINPLEPWDLGHDDHDRTRYQGPEHRRCNRSAGAVKGNSSPLRHGSSRRPLTADRW
jgi:hypothetical protein